MKAVEDTITEIPEKLNKIKNKFASKKIQMN